MKINIFQEPTIDMTDPRKGAIKKWKKFISLLESNPIAQEFCAKKIDRKPTFNIILTSDKGIQDLNHAYRNKDWPTDVLTFSYDNNQLPWGDIFISLETAEKQARAHNVFLEEELTLLSIHGILHACGFDHEASQQDHQFMRKYELQLLRSMKLEHVLPLTQ